MKQSMILNRAYYYTMQIIEREKRYDGIVSQARIEKLNKQLDELHEMILKAESEEAEND